MPGPAAAANRKLFTAAKKGDAAAVRAALTAGADVAARDNNGWTALHEAARWGQAEACALLLAAGADANAAHPDFGYTPLFVATFQAGHVAVVRALLEGGAAPSLAGTAGWTPLHNAAEQGDLDALTALLEAGGDPAALGGPEHNVGIAGRAPADKKAAIETLVARLARVRKQTGQAAQAAAAATRKPEKRAPFSEAKPLDMSKVRVKGTPTPVATADLARLEKSAGGLPAGYDDFVSAHGPGTLAGKVRVYGPRAILAARAKWHARLAQHWFWGQGDLVTQTDAASATRVADTIDGDELVFHPRAPDTLVLLPRESSEVVLVSKSGLLPALTRLLGRVPARLSLEPLADE
jgi:hypothetical protein